MFKSILNLLIRNLIMIILWFYRYKNIRNIIIKNIDLKKIDILKINYLKKIIVYYKMSEKKKYSDLIDFLKKNKTIPEKTFTHTALG